MESGTEWRRLEQWISSLVKLPRRAVAIAFLDAPPAGVGKFPGTQPSGCSFSRLAAAGQAFYTVPENHFNCAVGAHTHNIPLSLAREKETGQTLKMMFDLGYVKPEEIPQISAAGQNSGGYCLRSTRRCPVYARCGVVC